MFVKILLIAAILVFISFLGLGIRVFGKKDGSFPETSIGKNKEMRKKGITCPRHDEIVCYKTGKENCSC